MGSEESIANGVVGQAPMEGLKARRVLGSDGADDHRGQGCRLALLCAGLGHAAPPDAVAGACSIARATRLRTTTTGWLAWWVTW